MSDEIDYDEADLKRRMNGALMALQTEFSALRTGRASPNLLDKVQVSAYGSNMPLNQVASVSVPEARLITVTVWDKSLVNTTDKAIRDAGLGLNPVMDGDTLRIPIPPLNEERRLELARLAGKYTETARVAVRNVRRDGMDTLKAMEKAGDISKDDHKAFGDDVQAMTDTFIKQIDEALKSKEEEIMQV